MAEVVEFRVPAGSGQTLLVWGLEPEPGLEVRRGEAWAGGLGLWIPPHPGPGDRGPGSPHPGLRSGDRDTPPHSISTDGFTCVLMIYF